MTKISIEISSPHKEESIKKVEIVNLPGKDGRIGILADHTPCMVALTSGVIEISCSNDKKNIAIESGFAHFVNNICKIVVPEYRYIEE